MRLNDAPLGLVFVVLAAWMAWVTTSFPSFPGQDYGPALFPRIIAAGMAVCGAVLVLRGVRARRQGRPGAVAGGADGRGAEPWIALEDWARQPRRLISFLLLPGAVLLYILVADWLGFLITAFGILLALFLWFRVRWPVALGVAAGMTWAVHWFFADMMRVPLPRGLLTDWL